MVRAIWNRWCAYWLRPAPLADLAVCRILFVGFQLYYMLTLMDAQAQFARLTALPDDLYDPFPVLHLLNLPFGWHYRPTLGVLEGLFAITVLAGVLALIGLRTKISLAVFTIGNVYLQAFFYAFGDFHHPQGVLMIALATLALSPAGAVLSLDARRRVARRIVSSGQVASGLSQQQSAFARWPLLLVQWVLALAYLSAAISKLHAAGWDWVNGYTLQYYLIEDGVRWGRDLGLWVGSHHLLSQILSWATVLFEGTFCLVLILPRLRWLYVPMGLAFHLGTAVFMKAYFPQFMVLYSALVPWTICGRTLRRWAESHRGVATGPRMSASVGLSAHRGGAS